MSHRPEAFTEPPGNLGGGNGNTDVDDQRNRRQPREQPEQEQRSKDDFHDSHKGSHNAGSGNADARETSDAKSLRKEKLLYALGEENAPTEKTNQDDGTRRIDFKKQLPSRHERLQSRMINFTPRCAGPFSPESTGAVRFSRRRRRSHRNRTRGRGRSDPKAVRRRHWPRAAASPQRRCTRR